MALRNLDSEMQKNEAGSLSYTINKTKFKIYEIPKYEEGIRQNPRIGNRH